jgi:hypothetical protein
MGESIPKITEFRKDSRRIAGKDDRAKVAMVAVSWRTGGESEWRALAASRIGPR